MDITGETLRWKTDGMVDVMRVYELSSLYLQRMEMVLSLMDLMESLGVSRTETLSALTGVVGQTQTPGCDCAFCSPKNTATPVTGKLDDLLASIKINKDTVLN